VVESMPQMEMLLNCTAVKQAASIVVTTACPPLRCVLPLPAPLLLWWRAAELRWFGRGVETRFIPGFLLNPLTPLPRIRRDVVQVLWVGFVVCAACLSPMVWLWLHVFVQSQRLQLPVCASCP
jgi:hypothetical protein